MFELREEVEDFFSSMDRDFDGRLSFEEFMGEVAFQFPLWQSIDMKSTGKYNRKAFQKHGQEWGWGRHKRGEL